MNETKRSYALDMARGIAILTVIIGHTNCPPWLKHYIYGFHMPFFFILSGYLFSDKNVLTDNKAFVKKSFKRYMVPYYSMAFLNLLLYGSFMTNSLKDIINKAFGIIYSAGNTYLMPNCSPLWFLPTLFCTVILFKWLLTRNKIYSLLVICAGYALTFLDFTHYNIISLPLHIEIAMFSIIFMYIGRAIKKYNIIDKINRIWYIIIMTILGTMGIFLNESVGMASCQLGIVPLTIFNSSLMFLTIVCICTRCINIKPLEYLGKNTLFIIGYNYMLNELWRVTINKLGIVIDNRVAWIVQSLFVTVFCFIGIYIWTQIKSYYKKIKV